MKIYIRNGSMTPEVLEYLGYGKVKPAGKDAWEAERIGIPHEAVFPEEDGRSLYGHAIAVRRREEGIPEADFARMMLLEVAKVRWIESGKEALSDEDIHTAAGILSVKADPLRQGIIQPITDLEQELETCRQLLTHLQDILTHRISEAERLTGNKRFLVKPSEDSKSYLIFDAALMDFVREEDGEVLLFASPVAALDAAYTLEKTRPGMEKVQEKEATGPSPETAVDFLVRREEGLLFLYDASVPDQDGSDRLLAVMDPGGNLAVIGELDEEKEAGLLRYAGTLAVSETVPKKPEAEETGSVKKDSRPLSIRLL